MPSRLLMSLIVVLLAALMIAGCSKNESSPTEPEGGTPTIPTVSFKGPNTNSQDNNAVMVKSYVAAINALTTAFAPLAALPGVQNGNVWTWTYTDRTLTIRFTATRQGDGSYVWKMVLNGIDPDDQTVYNNWTAIEGTSSADSKSGSWKIYAENTTTLEAEYIWTTVNNVLTGTLKEYTNNVVSYQTVVTNNPDNSGELKVYTQEELTELSRQKRSRKP